MKDNKIKDFTTYQPANISPSSVTKPSVFNGMCLVRKYRVIVVEVEESDEVIAQRLRHLWANKRELGIGHKSNISAMLAEAEKLGIEL